MIAQKQSKRSSGAPAWIFIAGRLVVAIPILLLLLVVEESWRGRHSWEHHRHELEAKGEPMDWAAFAPPDVPDAQNIFKAPKMSEWFVGRGMTDLSRRMSVTNFINSPKQTGVDTLADVAITGPETPVDPATTDLILSFRYPYLTLAAASSGSAKTPVQEAVMPLIRMEDVPLTDAVENLSRQIQLKCEWDARIPFKRPASDPSHTGEPIVTKQWTKVTARKALHDVLADNQLRMKPIPGTDAVRITLREGDESDVCVDPAADQKLRQLLGGALATRTNSVTGPGLEGTQHLFFLGHPITPLKPVHIIVRADDPLSVAEVSALVPRNASCSGEPAASITVEGAGDRNFRVRLSQPMGCSAADYLTWSDQFTPDFDLIREALKRPSARMDGDYTYPESMPIPNYTTLRALGQLLCQRTQCELLLGIPDAALGDLTLLHGLGRFTDGGSAKRPVTMVSAMITVALTGLYTDAIADGVHLRAWNDSQLTAIQSQLTEVHLVPQVVGALQEERASWIELFQHGLPRIMKHSTLAGEPPAIREARAHVSSILLNHILLYPNLLTMSRLIAGYQESCDASNELVRPRIVERASIELRKVERHFHPYTFLASLAVPEFGRGILTMAQNQTKADEAFTACALERYRMAVGHYPRDLGALTPKFICKIPKDVVSGESLKYRLSSDNNFLLYSVGWNETDDGGKVVMTDDGKSIDSTEGDWVWPTYPAK